MLKRVLLLVLLQIADEKVDGILGPFFGQGDEAFEKNRNDGVVKVLSRGELLDL